MPALNMRPARWRDCWALYTWRRHLSPSFSFWKHLRWFAWRVGQPYFWIAWAGKRRLGYLRIDVSSGLRWVSCQRAPDSPPGPGRWMMMWLEGRQDLWPAYGVISNDNKPALRYTPQPPWKHQDHGKWTLVQLGEDEDTGSIAPEK